MRSRRFEVVPDPRGSQYGTTTRRTRLTRAEAELTVAIFMARQRVERAEKRLGRLLDECSHRVRYDIGGVPCDMRCCAICGGDMGFV